jgi:hypothetical protein
MNAIELEDSRGADFGVNLLHEVWDLMGGHELCADLNEEGYDSEYPSAIDGGKRKRVAKALRDFAAREDPLGDLYDYTRTKLETLLTQGEKGWDDEFDKKNMGN